MIDDVFLFLFSRACCIFTRSRPQTLQLCRPTQVSKCLVSHDAMESSTEETLLNSVKNLTAQKEVRPVKRKLNTDAATFFSILRLSISMSGSS